MLLFGYAYWLLNVFVLSVPTRMAAPVKDALCLLYLHRQTVYEFLVNGGGQSERTECSGPRVDLLKREQQWDIQ